MENDTQQNMETPVPAPASKPEVVKVNMKRVKIIIGILLTVIIIVAAVALQLYFKSRSLNSEPNSAAAIQANKAELAKLVEVVGKLIVLPQDEEPTLATVSDPEKLKDQAFFKNAVLGDKVLIYSRAQKAILYSPSKNKIIEVAPINLTAPTNTTPVPLATTTQTQATNLKLKKP